MTIQDRDDIIAQINELTHRIDNIVLSDRSSYLRLQTLSLARRNLYDQLNEYDVPDGGLDICSTLGGRKI